MFMIEVFKFIYVNAGSEKNAGWWMKWKKFRVNI